jgi:hypothetical protein
MRRLALAVVIFGSLEVASLGVVVAIGREAPQAAAVRNTSDLRDCVEYVIASTPVMRCPGG